MKHLLKLIVIIICLTQLISAGPCLSKSAQPATHTTLAAAAAASKRAEEAAAIPAAALVPAMPTADRVALGHAMHTHLPVLGVWNIVFEYMKKFNPSLVRTFNTNASETRTTRVLNDQEFITVGKSQKLIAIPSPDPDRSWSLDIHLWHVGEDLPTKTFVQELPEASFGRYTGCDFMDIVPIDGDRFVVHGNRNIHLRHKNEAEVVKEFRLEDTVSIKKIISLGRGKIAGIEHSPPCDARVIFPTLDDLPAENATVFSESNELNPDLWNMARMNDGQVLISLSHSKPGGPIVSLLFLRDIATQQVIKSFNNCSMLHDIYPLDNNYFLTVSASERVTLWHKDREDPVRTVQTSGPAAVIDENWFMVADKQNRKIDLYHKHSEQPAQSYPVPWGIIGINMMGKDHFIIKLFIAKASRDDKPSRPVHQLWRFDTRMNELKELYAAYLKMAAVAAKSQATVEVIS